MTPVIRTTFDARPDVEAPFTITPTGDGSFTIADRCEALAPSRHAQAGTRCEREPHAAEVNHKVSPHAGKPGAVWRDPVA